MKRDALIHSLQTRIPDLLAIYAFGSRIQGTARLDSDLDLAVLVAGYTDPLILFEVANELADVAGYAVDLLDLRAASTVMQYQIITTGERWWTLDMQAALFEAFILSEKTQQRLNAAWRGHVRNTLPIQKVLPLITLARMRPFSTFSEPAKQRWTWASI